MSAINQLSVDEIGRTYDRLHEIGIPETIHITMPTFVRRFWMDGQCLFVRDLVDGQQVYFLMQKNHYGHSN